MEGERIPETGRVGIVILTLLCVLAPICHASRKVIDLESGPESVIWVVQLSDLHFSVHHPDRALDFKRLVAPSLSLINPCLVLITGDLTDGKSTDLLTMKQNEDEWVEYKNVMEDVMKMSGLNKSIFYDLRGNHDNFGVPLVGGLFDFFSKYSINGQLRRRENVNSVTIQTGESKNLFVSLDSTMHVGVRGPTNLFGHPTNQLLNELEAELSQWDTQQTKLVTKIAFGHFPLSFSAFSESGKSLKDVFLKHSLSSYLCGHLHTRFGKNLKRHHQSAPYFPSSQELFQLNMQQIASQSTKNCSVGAPPLKEFWEWEMGDWRKSRAMRILAVDRGHVSYVDIDLKSGTKRTIILPTFPLDSCFMSSSSSKYKYECQHTVLSSYETVRALVFSISPIVSVVARIYDSRPGFLNLVLEAPMRKHADAASRGDLYTARWNYRAFEDPSPDRYWLQIEATDIMGRLTLTELRPFSVSGQSAKISWTWKEFFVMGCQWAALYYPIFWSALFSLLLILLVPKGLLIFSKKHYMYKTFVSKKTFINGIAWILQDLCRLPIAWFGLLGYLLYLILFPWLFGKVFTDNEKRAYMTYMGWVIKISDGSQKHEYIGSPDIMVVTLPHLFFVVLPAILVMGALAAERGVYREHILLLSGKKEGYMDQEKKISLTSKFWFVRRFIRKILLLLCMPIFWKHIKNCRSLIRAYEMNPLHFPGYSLTIPLLLVYVIFKTKGV